MASEDSDELVPGLPAIHGLHDLKSGPVADSARPAWLPNEAD
jgi:hypothetical protein